jgi:hypothetical protein
VSNEEIHMNVTAPALTSALTALRYYSGQVDRAAAQIANAGLDVVPAPTAGTPPSPLVPAADVPDLGAAMVSMMIAQRAFSAQLRVIETADQMLSEVVARK